MHETAGETLLGEGEEELEKEKKKESLTDRKEIHPVCFQTCDGGLGKETSWGGRDGIKGVCREKWGHIKNERGSKLEETEADREREHSEDKEIKQIPPRDKYN